MKRNLEGNMVYCHRCDGHGITPVLVGALRWDRCKLCKGSGQIERERYSNAIGQRHEIQNIVAFREGMLTDAPPSYSQATDEWRQLIKRESVYASAAPAEGSGPTEIRARMAVPIEWNEGAPPAEIMVFPGGEHSITAFKAGKPYSTRVKVDRSTAATMQAALEAHRAAGPQKPWFDFNHAEEAASAWPTRFFWKEDAAGMGAVKRPEGRAPGVYAAVEWSKAGAEAVQGKMYRAFSPVFFLDNSDPQKVIGAPLNMGGLVNQPAFKEISPLFATGSGDPAYSGQGNNKTKHMTEQELAALQAKQAQLEKENAELRAKAASSDTDTQIKAKDAEIALLKQERDTHANELKAKRKSHAEQAVKAAQARGAIPPKDEAVKAKWVALIESDPGNEVLLAAQPGNPALTPVTVATATGNNGHTVVITREDSLAVLAAYGGERDPRKAAAIYAREIRPRLNKGEDFPLILKGETDAIKAANSMGTVAGTVVLQRALDLMVTSFPSLSKFSTDFRNIGMKFNQTVNTRLITEPSVDDYNTTTGYSVQFATTTDVPVVLDKHKSVTLSFHEEELASSTRDYFGEQTRMMGYALGKAIIKHVYSKITVANFNNETVIPLPGFKRTGVMALGRKLTDREVPDEMRFLGLMGSYYDKLGEDTIVISAFNNPGAGDAIRSGRLPEVHNFEVADTKVMQTTESLAGFASFPAALAIAAAVPNDYTTVFPGVTGGAVTRVITNPDSGFSLLQVQFVDHNLANARMRFATMFGAAKGEPKALERLVTAAN